MYAKYTVITFKHMLQQIAHFLEVVLFSVFLTPTCLKDELIIKEL